MKNLLILLSVFFFTVCIWAQSDMLGRWNIDNIPGLKEQSRFLIIRIEPSASPFYGNSIELLENGKFKASHTAWCGNDCFPNTFGKFEKLGENYIRFHADSIVIWGLSCKNERRYPNKDIGTYFIHKTSEGTKLLLSTGNSKTDRINASYCDFLDKFYKTENLIKYLFKKVEATDDHAIVAEALSDDNHFNISNLRVLYAENVPSSYWLRVIIFEHNGKKYIMIFKSANKTAGLYNGAFTID